MASPLNSEWIKSHIELPAACVSSGLALWSILRACQSDRHGQVFGALLGGPEYVSMATMFASLSVLLVFAWSRQFWPRTRFMALYGMIAQCRDAASAIHDASNSDGEEHAVAEDRQHVVKLLHRVDELKAALHMLGIRLHVEGTDTATGARLLEELRGLAATAQVGDIRGARAMCKPEVS